MNDIKICSAFNDSLQSLFVCEDKNGYQRIRTPYLYPDGEVIDIYCKPESTDIMLVTDFGETGRWLRMQTTSPRRSPKQKALIADICLTHGVEFFQGMLMARCRSEDNVSEVVNRVAQAALRMSDIWFTFRTRSVESMSDEVADFLLERQMPYERQERLNGRSGRIWRPDFHVRAPQHSSLVYVLSTGSRASARSITEHVVTAFLDLSHLNAGPEAMQFISLFDDTADVWTEGDFRLAEHTSTIARWSQPDGFAEMLEAA